VFPGYKHYVSSSYRIVYIFPSVVVCMAYDIIIGRNVADRKKFGRQGLIFLGKGFVTMGVHTSLSNNLFMDVARSHVVLVAGKRGSGKSYTLGVLTEEMSNLDPDVAGNIAPLIFDTMGIFWTMKYANEKDKKLLDDWGLEGKNLPIRVFAPFGKFDEYREQGVPVDFPFALRASELDIEDWVLTFGVKMTSLEGVLMVSVISRLKESGEKFSIDDILGEVAKVENASTDTKNIVSALFTAANSWGIFARGKEGTKIEDLVEGGVTSIIDLSAYSSIGAFNIRALVIGLVSRKLFERRMAARKREEVESVTQGVAYDSFVAGAEVPLIWLFIDEAHEFLPKHGKTPATDSLVQILREGRQPGISLVLATQQPGQIHTDVLTQSDIVLSHRVTAKADVEALNSMMQSYLLSSIQQSMDSLPSLKGSAIILDDNSERIYPMRMRPRLTWHGGEAPVAVRAED